MFCPNCDSKVPNGAAVCENCGVQFKAAPVAKARSSGGGRKSGGGGGGAAPPSYLLLSILATMFCCMPAGIVAIIKSTQVGGAVARGDYNAAREASDAAMKWCGISFMLALLYLAFSVAMLLIKTQNGGAAV